MTMLRRLGSSRRLLRALAVSSTTLITPATSFGTSQATRAIVTRATAKAKSDEADVESAVPLLTLEAGTDQAELLAHGSHSSHRSHSSHSSHSSHYSGSGGGGGGGGGYSPSSGSSSSTSSRSSTAFPEEAPALVQPPHHKRLEHAPFHPTPGTTYVLILKSGERLIGPMVENATQYIIDAGLSSGPRQVEKTNVKSLEAVKD